MGGKVSAEQRELGKHVKMKRCASSGKVSVGKDELSKHILRTHSGIRSPESKKIRTDQGCNENTEEDEIMDIDHDLVSLSNKNDEKVLMMQKRFDEEDERLKEKKIEKDMRDKEKDIKRRNKSNSEKKKNKKKEDKTKAEEDVKVISNTKDR